MHLTVLAMVLPLVPSLANQEPLGVLAGGSDCFQMSLIKNRLYWPTYSLSNVKQETLLVAITLAVRMKSLNQWFNY